MYFKSFQRILHNQCANCTKSFAEEIRNANHNYHKSKSSSNASTALIFTNLELDSSPVEDVTNFQAVSYIYGVSPVVLENSIKKYLTNLSKHNDAGSSALDEENEDEEDDPLSSLNLNLCQNCSRILAELYIIFSQFEKLSNKKSIIAKGLQYSKDNSEFQDIKLESLSEEEIFENTNERNNIDDLQNSHAEQLESGSIKEELDSDSFSTFDEGNPSAGEEDYHYDAEDTNPFHGAHVEAEEEASQNSVRVELRRSLRRPRKSVITVRSSLTDNEDDDIDKSMRSNSSSDEYSPSEELDSPEKYVPHGITKRKCIEKRGKTTCTSPKNTSSYPLLSKTIAPTIKPTQCKRCLKVFTSSYYKNLHELAQKLDIKALEKQKLRGDCSKCPKCEIGFIRVSPGPTQLKIHCLKEHNLIVSRSEANKLEQFTQNLLSEKYYCDKNKKPDYSDNNTEIVTSKSFINVQVGSEKMSITTDDSKLEESDCSTSKKNNNGNGKSKSHVPKNGKLHSNFTSSLPLSPRNQCDRCLKVFCLLYYKQMHIYVQHRDIKTLPQETLQEDRYKCPQCGMGFNRKSPGPLQLKAHCLTKHNLIVSANDDRLEQFIQYLHSEKEHCNKNRNPEVEKEGSDVQKMAIAAEDSKSKVSDCSTSKKNNNGNGKSRVIRKPKLHSNVTSSLPLSNRNQCNRCLKDFCLLYYKQMHTYVQHREIKTLAQETFNSLKGDRLKCPQCGMGFNSKSPGPLQLKAHCLTKHSLIVSANDNKLKQFIHYLQSEKEHCNKNKISIDGEEESDVQEMAIAGEKKMDQSQCSYGTKPRRSQLRKHGKAITNAESVTVKNEDDIEKTLECNMSKDNSRYSAVESGGSVDNKTDDRLGRKKSKTSENNSVSIEDENKNNSDSDKSSKETNLIKFGFYYFQCIACKKYFSHIISFKRHITKVHNIWWKDARSFRKWLTLWTQKSYNCEVCDDFYISKQELNVHLLAHMLEQCNAIEFNEVIEGPPFRCPISKCQDPNKDYNNWWKLQIHGFKAHEVAFTNKRQQETIKSLSPTDTEVIKTKKLSCNTCEAQFPNVKSLWMHTLVHIVEGYEDMKTAKTYEAFSESLLGSVVDIETNVKKDWISLEANSTSCSDPSDVDVCSNCKKSFKSFHAMKMHQFAATIVDFNELAMEKVSGQEFICSLCGIVCERSIILREHCLSNHKMIISTKNYQAEEFLKELHKEKEHCDQHSSVTAKIAYQSDNPCQRCCKAFISCDNKQIHTIAQKLEVESLNKEVLQGLNYLCPKCDKYFTKDAPGPLRLIIHCILEHNLIVAESEAKMEKFMEHLQSEKKHCNGNVKENVKIVNEKKTIVRTCSMCERVSSSPFEMKIHSLAHKIDLTAVEIINVEGSVNFQCPRCPRVLASNIQLRGHCLETHSVVTSTYDIPVDQFVQFLKEEQEFIRRAVDNSNNIEQKNSGNGNEEMLNSEHTTTEMEIEEGVLKKSAKRKTKCSFKCGFCSKTFSRAIEKYTHVLKHFDWRSMEVQTIHGPPFKCTSCDDVLPTFRSIRVHCISVHGFNVSNNYKFKTPKYPDASSELQTSSGVEKVTVVPHKEINEKFICDTCGKSYGTKAYLISHKRFVHRLEKQFMCERCGVWFKQLNLLRFHRKVHYEKDNGIRPTCNICGKDYISSACLAKHKRKYHSKKKPFCPICNKTFASKDYAAVHIKKHKQLANK